MVSPTQDELLQQKYEEYKRLYSTDPEDRIWSAVAEAFNMAGDGRRSVAALERAIALNADWGRHHLDLAKTYLQAKQWMKAARSLDRCADLDASGCRNEFFAESYLYYLGYALFGAKRFKEAAEAWRGADHVIRYWGTPEPLKDFHLHRGWAHHLEGDFLDAIEAYRRGLIAPGPGDCALDDDMDTDLVEDAQGRMNPALEEAFALAKAAQPLDASHLEATPYTS
jgi:tetratricopeptide (TPR) repeat protein